MNTLPKSIPGYSAPVVDYDGEVKVEKPKKVKLNIETKTIMTTAMMKAEMASLQSVYKFKFDTMGYEERVERYGKEVADMYVAMQEAKENKRIEKQAKRYAYLLTINAAPNVDWETFYMAVEKYVTSKPLQRTPVIYAYERRWANDEAGYHAHVLVKVQSETKDSDILREVERRFGNGICEKYRKTGNKNRPLTGTLDLKYMEIDEYPSKVQYIMGTKVSDKQEYVEKDKEWRREIGIQDYYTNVAFEEENSQKLEEL